MSTETGGALLKTRHLHQAAFLLLSLMAVDQSLHGQQHPAQPTVNLGDTSFLDALGAPGVLIEEIGDASHSSTKRNGMGQPVSGASL